MKALQSRITKKHFIVAGIGLAVALVIILIIGAVAFSKRERLLADTISRMETAMDKDYRIHLAIDTAYFSGLSTVTLEGITLTPHERKQLVSVHNMSVRVKLLPLLFGNVKFARLLIHEPRLSLVKTDSISNYDFLLQKKEAPKAQPEIQQTASNLAERTNQMLNKVLYKIPTNMEIRDFSLTYQDDSTEQRIRVPETNVERGSLTSAIFLNDNTAAWQVAGTLNPDKRQLYVKVHANGTRIAVPLLDRKFGLNLSFDTIETRLQDVFWSDNELLHFKGEWAVKNLTINNWRIAEHDVVVPDAHMDAELIVGRNHVELAKETAITVKKLTVHPYFRYTADSNTTTYTLAVETPEMEAQDLFDAFPSGLFTSLEGIRVAGKIQYHMDAFLDTSNPDSMQFNSEMRQDNFRVNAWGNANIPKINTTFTYTPYENDKPVRDITVGPGNPNFVPIGQISPYLKNAILTTEDPSFYSHNGFVEEAIRTSIATNYKARAFKRGGSTISMQLVKNVYLNRNKTIVRKLEEVLIVWLLESTRAVPKDRMYEVYLNIIEWGRNVYGIGEAARYYFSKHPAELTLGESIYLASIVPRPKTGLYAFTYYGELKPYISRYFSYIGNIMARRGLAPPDPSGNYGFNEVSVREALRPERPASADPSLIQLPEVNFDIQTEDIRGILDQVFGENDNNEQENQ